MAQTVDPDLDAIIGDVPAWDGAKVTATPLASGITNRNYRVGVDGDTFVVRISGRDTELLGIDREHEHAAARAAAEAGVGPEVFAFLPQHGCLITRFVEGTPIPGEDLQRPEVLRRTVGSIRAIHGCPPLPSTFSPFRVVEEYRDVAVGRGVRIPEACAPLLERARRIEMAFASAPMPSTTCHNDLLNANFIWTGDRVVIVDYEYAGMGDPFFDLGNFSVNNALPEETQHTLLKLYFGDVTPSRLARLALMRIMSDFREAMWGVVQQGLSALDFDYVGYADKHFGRCLENTGDARFEHWLRDAGGTA